LAVVMDMDVPPKETWGGAHRVDGALLQGMDPQVCPYFHRRRVDAKAPGETGSP
jgi:hypothetical protein